MGRPFRDLRWQWMSKLVLIGVLLQAACQAKPTQAPTLPNFGATPILTVAPLPTATAAVVATTTQPATPTGVQILPGPQGARDECRDDLKVLLQLSPLKGSSNASPVMPIGSTMTIGWRVQNIGECIWDSSYTVALASAASPDWPKDTPPIMLRGLVKPGGFYDLWVETRLPSTPGEHRAIWELRDGRGEPIGERMEFEVFAIGAPTDTALPDVILRASPDVVYPGGQTAISWNAPHAKAAYFYTIGQAWREHPVTTQGERYEYPQRTTTYELRIVKSDNSVEFHRVTVIVKPFDPPRIVLFRIRPRGPVTSGQCVEIEWETRNPVNRLELYRNGSLIWTGKLSSGTLRHCPPTGENLYMLSVIGPGGSDTAERSLEVR